MSPSLIDSVRPITTVRCAYDSSRSLLCFSVTLDYATKKNRATKLATKEQNTHTTVHTFARFHSFARLCLHFHRIECDDESASDCRRVPNSRLAVHTGLRSPGETNVSRAQQNLLP